MYIMPRNNQTGIEMLKMQTGSLQSAGDITGLEFIRAIAAKRPMINCAAVSSLTSEDFHEASEGLGILMQLPVEPGRKHADMLLEQLKSILNTMKI
jgi:hypothetical protein